VDAVRPAFLQLHGGESVERAQAIAERTGTPVIKAIKTTSAADLYAARAFESVAAMMLFDAPPAAIPGALPGGNGVAFDWTLLRDAPLRRNFMLSGGLDPDNVVAALERSGAAAVDVSSGVEHARGMKSPELIRNFVARAKAYALAEAAAEF
jgi:phosphoribosylanthranilate isomerase